MSQLLDNYDGVICHADDILVFGRDKMEHDQRLRQVLQKLQSEGLTLNEKCEFGKGEMLFVGHSKWFGGRPKQDTFRNFAREFKFIHTTSSPHYPQANWEAERAVRTLKGLWKKERDYSKALLVYRATPLEHGFSPSQLLMGRRSLPQPPGNLSPVWPNLKEFRKKDEAVRERQAINYNQRHGSCPLPKLHVGQKVWLATEHVHGSVIGPAHTPRSYLVDTSRGMLRRNRPSTSNWICHKIWKIV
ncbi:hypothetical protein SRHO_G00010050 [Serrasalmus rhombeus]